MSLQPANASSPHSFGAFYSWRLVILLAAICFTAHFNRVSMSVAGDMRIMDQFGISTTSMGGVYSAFLLAYTLAMIPGGWLIDRFGPRLALTLVCLGSAVFVLLTGVVGLAVSSAGAALAALIVVRAAMGTLSSPLHPAAAKSVALGVPFRFRSAANGLVTGAALLGIASTYVVFGGLIQWLDWPGAFAVAALVTAALGLLWLFAAGDAVAHGSPPLPSWVAKQPRVIDNRAPVTRLLELVHDNRNLLLLTCSYAAVGYFQYLFFYWMHYYFESVLSLGEEQSQRYAGYPPLAMALCMPLGGWLSDQIQLAYGWRTGRARLAMVAMAASAALLVLGIRATDPVWIVTWLSLALGVLGMAEGPFWATAVEVGGNRGGLSASVFNTGGNAGGILAPIVTPWVSDSLGFGWQTGIALGSGVCLAGAILWHWIDDPIARALALETTRVERTGE